METGEWKSLAPMLVDRASFAMGVLSNNRIIVAGGERQHFVDWVFATLKSCEMYDIDNNEWHKIKSMNICRNNCVSSVWKSHYFVVASGIDCHRSVEKYDPFKDEWYITKKKYQNKKIKIKIKFFFFLKKQKIIKRIFKSVFIKKKQKIKKISKQINFFSQEKAKSQKKKLQKKM